VCSRERATGRFFGIALTSRPVSATFDTSNGGEVVAVSGSRCCGVESIGCTCKPWVPSARDSAAKRRLSTLSAACFLVFGAHVATARAQDAPQPPLPPTVPTVAVEVSVSVPGVTLIVEAGTVDISVSTASVDVSVSVSSEDTSSSPEETGAPPQQTTQSDGPSDCCSGEAKQVASPGASAKATRAPRAVAPEPRPRPTIPATANTVRARTTRKALTDRSTHVAAAKKIPPTPSELRATRPHARRSCCAAPPAEVGSAPVERLALPAEARLQLDRIDGAQMQAAALPVEHVRDNRLLLQLGVLGAFLYLVCLAGWFSAKTLRRRRA
jgi:hypothetical protein